MLNFPRNNISDTMTVAEAIEILKTLPPDFILMREEVSDSGWREDVEIENIEITPNWESYDYHCWDRTKPMTSKTHCVTFN